MDKTIKITIPPGMELDTEKSTETTIVFKKTEKKVKRFEDIHEITGYWINVSSVIESIKSLRNEVKSYRDELVNLERGTEEYNATLQKLAASQSQINNITDMKILSNKRYNDLTNIITRLNKELNTLKDENICLTNKIESMKPKRGKDGKFKAKDDGLKLASSKIKPPYVNIDIDGKTKLFRESNNYSFSWLSAYIDTISSNGLKINKSLKIVIKNK